MTAILRTAASSSQAIGRLRPVCLFKFQLVEGIRLKRSNSPERVGLIAFAQMLSARVGGPAATEYRTSTVGVEDEFA